MGTSCYCYRELLPDVTPRQTFWKHVPSHDRQSACARSLRKTARTICIIRKSIEFLCRERKKIKMVSAVMIDA